MLTIVIVVVLLPVSLYMVLRSNYVQNYLVQKVATYFSNELETEVKVGGVDVTFFMNIVLEEVTVKDRYNEPLIYVDRLVFNTGRFSFRKRFFTIKKLSFENANINLVKYLDDDTYNFQFLIDYFSPEIKKEDPKPWDITCKSFEFKNSDFVLLDMNREFNNRQFDPGNISMSSLNLDISDIYFKKDTLTIAIEHFSFIESSGFELTDFSGDVCLSEKGSSITNMALKTNYSQLHMDAVVDYDSPDDFKNFAEKVSFDFDFKPSYFGFTDIGVFLEEFAGKDEKVLMKGSLEGRFSNFRGRDFLLAFGQATVLDGNFFVTGLPKYDNTFLNLSVNEFRTIRKDIDRFTEVADIKTIDNQLYNYLVNLGNMHFTGNLTGFLNDFVAYGNLYTDIGVIKSDIALYDDDVSGEIGYRGSLATQSFDMGKFLDQQTELGKVDFDFFVEGSGITFETAVMELEGIVDKITLMDYSYRNIDLSANLINKRFNGSFLVGDPNVNIDFAGIIDFRESPYHFDFYTEINDANLTNLNIYQRDSLFNSIISSNLSLNIKATSFDDVAGDIIVKNTIYTEASIDEDTVNTYNFDNIFISNYIDEKLRKNLRINSGIVDVNINGDIKFEYFANSVNSFLASFMPSWYASRPDTLDQSHRMDFDYLVEIKDVTPVTDLFMPGLSVAEGAKFEGYFKNNSNELLIKGNIPEIVYNNNIFHDFEIAGSRDDGKYVLETGCSRLMLSDTIWLDNLKLVNSMANDSLVTLLKWKNDDRKIKNEGWIESVAKFYNPHRFDLKILPSEVFINDSLWQVNLDHLIQIDSARYNVDNFMVYKKNEYIMIDGKISKNPEDELLLGLKDFDIANFDWFFERNNLSFDGLFSGDITISNLFGTPNVLADAEIVDFGFNNDHLGNLLLSTKYDHDIKGFEVLVEVVYFGNIGYNKPIVGSGFYYPEREGDNFDLDFKIENLKMSIFGRYLEGFAQNFRGMASGNLRLEGPAESPELTGRVRLARTGFRVDYLNTSYTFAHEVEIGKNYFAFENMVINDTIGNRARATGRVYHENFRDFALDIEILPDNLVLLNTTSAANEGYYGSAFATGRAHIHGPVDNIVMDIAARTNRGTRFFLPLTHRGELTESTFISFVSNNNDTLHVEDEIEHISKISGLTLNFDFEVTPDAEVQIIFDSQIGDIIRGRGYGNLSLEITSQGSFNMYGNYTLEEGDYLFTLQNMFNKRFRIEQGSTITWTGDPVDAEIDLKAMYRVRTALYDLVMEVDTSDVYRRRVPVDVVLEMKDELFNPDITFNINLPQSDEATREMVERLITTEQEMNRQIFSLLVLNRFMPTHPDRYNTALGYGVGMTSTEMLSNQVSNWLSQISSEFDIGINYRPGDEISSQELEVALSTQLFDDRLIIDGQVGVAGEHPASEQKASNIIGDVNIEYKITPEGRFRIKAFNRSNTFDVFNTNALYTQGIGLFYRKEFDNFSELFKRKNKETDDISEFEE